jgi:transcriptional regulator
MYVPSQFQEQRAEILHQLIGAHPLGTLMTFGADGLNADHIPFEIDPGLAPFGTLRAHVARGNPLWKEYSPDVESLVVFQGPQLYISPSWYATKQKDGRVVPTYNYMVVHAYGRMRVIEDPQWLRALLERLTGKFEAAQARPWSMDDAPADYIEKLLPAIVGIEIPVTRMIGKWKVSQNQPLANRLSVEQALREQGGANAATIADAVSSRTS